MRTAAAKFGLGLAAGSAREKIGSSVFMRRSSSTLAEADVWKKLGSESELNKEKSLYLCFSERSRGVDFAEYCYHVVRPIRLNSDDDGKDEEEYLSEAAYNKRCKVGGHFRFSGRFGSRILFPSRGHMSWVDTSTWPIKFEDSTTEFSSPKIDPVLMELNGKLYCIDKDNHSRPFEVFDHPEDDDCKWRALAKPPFAMKHNGSPVTPVCCSVLEGRNKKILAWLPEENGVLCFDPENGIWTESSFSLGLALPSLCKYNNTRPPIFIHNHHPDLGAFYLIFSYDPYCKPLVISPFFLSHDCDSIQPIGNKPIQLPAKLCSIKPIQIKPIHSFTSRTTDYELVHLGDQKVCLVLNKFFSDKNTGFLLLITFEYDVKASKSSVVGVRTRFLSTRRFQYHSKPNGGKEIYSLNLTGAFVL